MRSIGTLPTENAAVVFASSLYVAGIESQLEPEDEGGVSVWVLDDDQLDKARELLAKYRANPEAAEFQSAVTLAQKKRNEHLSKEKGRKSVAADFARLEYEKNFKAFAWLPTLLIVMCIAAGIWTNTISIMGGKDNREAISKLSITAKIADGNLVLNKRSLPEIEHGQVWRLVTPIFLHFGILHIVFNMMWLRDLGGFVQNRFGAGYLLLVVVITGATSNLAQFYMSGPAFGGMSGVNYGLFGFLWLRGKFDRFSGWQLNPMIVQTMLVWFFLCLVNIVPGVANTAHGVGLLVGMAWGYLSAKLAVIRR